MSYLVPPTLCPLMQVFWWGDLKFSGPYSNGLKRTLFHLRINQTQTLPLHAFNLMLPCIWYQAKCNSFSICSLLTKRECEYHHPVANFISSQLCAWNWMQKKENPLSICSVHFFRYFPFNYHPIEKVLWGVRVFLYYGPDCPLKKSHQAKFFWFF